MVERMTIEMVRDICDELVKLGKGSEGFRYYPYCEPMKDSCGGVVYVATYNVDGKEVVVFHGDE